MALFIIKNMGSVGMAVEREQPTPPSTFRITEEDVHNHVIDMKILGYVSRIHTATMLSLIRVKCVKLTVIS